MAAHLKGESKTLLGAVNVLTWHICCMRASLSVTLPKGTHHGNMVAPTRLKGVWGEERQQRAWISFPPRSRISDAIIQTVAAPLLPLRVNMWIGGSRRWRIKIPWGSARVLFLPIKLDQKSRSFCPHHNKLSWTYLSESLLEGAVVKGWEISCFSGW